MRKILLGTAIIAGFAVFMNECDGRLLRSQSGTASKTSSNTSNSGNTATQYGSTTTSAQNAYTNTMYNPDVNQTYKTPQQVYQNTIYTKPAYQGNSITQLQVQQPVSGRLNNTMTNGQSLKNQNGTATYNNGQVTPITTDETDVDWAVGTEPSGLTQGLREKNEWNQELDSVIKNRKNIGKELEKSVEQTIKGFENLKKEVKKLSDALKKEITKISGRENLAYWAKKLTLFDDITKKFKSMDKMIEYISGKCRPSDFNKVMDDLKHLRLISIDEIKLSLHNTIWWLKNDTTLSKYSIYVNTIGNRLVAIEHSAREVCRQIDGVIQANPELLNSNNDSAMNAANGLNAMKEILEKTQIMCDTVNDVIMGALINGKKPGLLQDVLPM